MAKIKEIIETKSYSSEEVAKRICAYRGHNIQYLRYDAACVTCGMDLDKIQKP